MCVAIREINNDKDANSINCLKDLISEHNPFTSIEIDDISDVHIMTWIHKHSHCSRLTNPSVTFWIIINQKPMGIATIKKELSEELYADSGHIGLCLVMSCRHKGYGKKALRLLIQEVKRRYALHDILLCCNYDNEASRALCLSVGGMIKHEDSLVHYWISEHVEDVEDI